jgi:hypothetical protein
VRTFAVTLNWATTSPQSICRDPRGSQRGYSLFETMIAATLFTLISLGVYAALIQSYKMAKLSRCHDESRAILRSYVDQFQRLQVTDPATGATRWLFTPTDGATGQGLVGVDQLNDQPNNDGAAAAAFLPISLGASNASVPARVTRDVSYVNPSTGALILSGSSYMLQAIFSIEFEISGRTYSQKMTVLRGVTT